MINKTEEKYLHPSLTREIIGKAIKVHATLGPGLLESTYEECLAYELNDAGFLVERQLPVTLSYERLTIESAYRLDLVIEGKVIVELKSVASLLPVHEAQLLTYMRLSGYPLGLLINFDVIRLKDGIKRFVRTKSK